MTTRILSWLCAALAVAALAGCASSSGRAPVSELGDAAKKPAVSTGTHVRKSVRAANDPRPLTHVVQKGDTLYGIAFNYGLDYHEIAEINNIQDPYLIHEKQEIRLFSTATVPVAASSPKIVESKPQGIPVKDQPKVAKLPYSEQAVAEIQKLQETPHKPESIAVAKIEPQSDTKPEVSADSAMAEDALEWGLPASGKVIGEFSESANRKGIDISGKVGQAVVASAAGKVVYSGSGLRGYGKLVIIKHNNTYLSAYAHNDQILVKEGQAVTKGQKIAEMGSTDSDQVKLHFEIRKFGKPVDPSKYLPLVKS
jgi:lipoprotein NlpD